MMKVITETHHEITLNSLIVCSSLSNLLDDFDFKIHVTVVELVTYIMMVLHCYINTILLSSYTAMPTARQKILFTSWNVQFVVFNTSEKLNNNLVNA